MKYFQFIFLFLIFLANCTPEKGCTDITAVNYNPDAREEDGTCVYENEVYGCLDSLALNYNPTAIIETDTCVYQMWEINEQTIDNQLYNVLSGEVNWNLTLTDSLPWILDGIVQVNNKKQLTIEAGTHIFSDKNDGVDGLIIEKNAKIKAIGTNENPIVFTSFTEESGDWIGVTINGNAPILANEFEEMCDFGGDVSLDDSGEMTYVRIEYGGIGFCVINGVSKTGGLTLNGVGSNTDLSFIETYKCKNQGLVINGGTVNLKYVLAYKNNFGGFGWWNAWSGKGQFWVAVHSDIETSSATYGIEADKPFLELDSLSFSTPELSNLTITTNDQLFFNGISFKNNAEGYFTNTLIDNTSDFRVFFDDSTYVNYQDSLIRFYNSTFEGDEYSFSNLPIEIDTSISFLNELTFENQYLGIDTTNFINPTTFLGSWFSSVNYSGAVDPTNDWTEGWVRKD